MRNALLLLWVIAKLLLTCIGTYVIGIVVMVLIDIISKDLVGDYILAPNLYSPLLIVLAIYGIVAMYREVRRRLAVLSWQQ